MPLLSRVCIALLPVLFISNQENKTMTKAYMLGDQQVVCMIEVFMPALVIRNDSSNMNQSTAVNCSRMFYSLLALGDIDGAAALSNDAAHVKEKYSRQKERAGEDEFKKMYAGYFTGSAQVKYLFSISKNHMLVVHSDDMGIDMAQFYTEDGLKTVVDDRGGIGKDQLGKIFQQLKDEEGNVTVK
jgi:hypothetical protein